MHRDWYPHTGINWIDKASGKGDIEIKAVIEKRERMSDGGSIDSRRRGFVCRQRPQK